jgi:predicted transcriptional regulator
MAAKAVFTMKLEPELRDSFFAEAAAADRPAAQVVRELMRDYIRQRHEERGYADFLTRKVEIARAQREAGQHASHEDVKARSDARRARYRKSADTDR